MSARLDATAAASPRCAGGSARGATSRCRPRRCRPRMRPRCASSAVASSAGADPSRRRAEGHARRGAARWGMLPSIGRSRAPSRTPDRGRIQTITNDRWVAPLRRASLSLLALWLAGSGCTSLREIPRGEYGARTERRDVRLVTREGLKYEFDYMRVEGDTLFGYRHREVESPVEEFGPRGAGSRTTC